MFEHVWGCCGADFIGDASRTLIRTLDAVVLAVWLRLMTTSPGRRDGFDGSKLFCSLMMSCLLLTCLMMGHNSCRMPWMQSLILLCAFVLLNFKQL